MKVDGEGGLSNDAEVGGTRTRRLLEMKEVGRLH